MFNKGLCFFVLTLLIGILTSAYAEISSSTKETIIISDMSRCKPASALSKEKKKNCWTLFSYETDEISGVMIGATSKANAQDVTLSLGVSGWYAIYLGFWNPHHDYDRDTIVKLILTGDPCFRVIADRAHDGVSAAPMLWDRAELRECFVRYADLTGKDLTIGQQKKGVSKKAYVAYIKLVPLSKDEVDSIKKDRARKDTRILIAANDGISFLATKGCTTKEEILEEVEPYRYSDVGKVHWAFTYGDITNYPTKVGTLWSAGMSSTTDSSADEITCRSLDILISKDLVPAKVVLEHVHDMGLEFHAMIRMGILGYVPPSDYWKGSLVTLKPEFRIVSKDGTPIEKASYAFEEVQDHMLALIREIAEDFDVDGISLCFICGPQFVGYEKPVIEDFKKKYGKDPRVLDENDIRIQQLRAKYMTQFIRKVRNLVNEVGEKKGKQLELSAWMFNYGHNMFYGLDVNTVVKERLLDSILAYGPEKFVKFIKDNNCKFYTWGGHTEELLKGNFVDIILAGYKNSVDGFTGWDINLSSQNIPESWSIVSRTGHKEEIEVFDKKSSQLKNIKLKTIGGKDICHTTNTGAHERGFYYIPEMLSIYSGG